MEQPSVQNGCRSRGPSIEQPATAIQAPTLNITSAATDWKWKRDGRCPLTRCRNVSRNSRTRCPDSRNEHCECHAGRTPRFDAITGASNSPPASNPSRSASPAAPRSPGNASSCRPRPCQRRYSIRFAPIGTTVGKSVANVLPIPAIQVNRSPLLSIQRRPDLLSGSNLQRHA